MLAHLINLSEADIIGITFTVLINFRVTEFIKPEILHSNMLYSCEVKILGQIDPPIAVRAW